METANPITRTITPTEYKYKIITAGSSLGIPVGKPITVEFNSKEYSAKTHSKSNGRIDSLSQLYKDSNLQVGDKITLSYDSSLNKIQISHAENTTGQDEETLISLNNCAGDLDTPSIGSDSNTNECKVKIESLGIIDSNSWKNLPYQSYLPHYYIATFGIASNNQYIILVNKHGDKKELYIFDRHTLQCHNLTLKLTEKINFEDTGSISNCAIIDNNLYWTQGKIVYKTSLIDGETASIYKLNRYKCGINEINDIYDGSDHLGEHGVFCTNKRWSEKSGHIRTNIINLSEWTIGAEMANIPGKYGEVIGTGPQGVLLNAGSEYNICTFYNNKTTSLFEYTFENSVYNSIRSNREAQSKFNRHVYAVDLHTHTVVIREYPELQLQGYTEGSLIKVEETKMYRLNNIYRGKKCEKIDNNYCNTIYRDCKGHEVAINHWYKFIYRNPDGTLVELFDTTASGVPEQFTVVDNHTAIVKVHEHEIAIVDFAENMKYIINIG